MAKRVLVFFAQGFETVEALTVVDYLRRAGIEVRMTALGREKTVVSGQDIPVTCDTLIRELVGFDSPGRFDAVVLPGGMPAAKTLAESPEIEKILNLFEGKNKLIAAICAAPALVLGAKGYLQGRQWTCYPGMEASCGGEWKSSPVVEDGNIITSRGAGTAGLFAVKIIEKLEGTDLAKKIKEQVVLA